MPFAEIKNGSPQLIKIIQDKILEKGMISFRDFMEMSLYEPHLGYYTSDREVWGKKGDYLTSPALHPIFGKLICRQLFEIWGVLGKPPEFTIIEAGSGSAALLKEIIECSESFSSEFYKSINPVIVDINLVGKQKNSSQSSWYSSLNEVRSLVTGCIISNELIDAFPVHIVTNDNGILKEVYVTLDNDGFTEVLDTPSDPAITEYLKGIITINGQRIEVNLEAVRYIKTAADILEKGFVITIDYGLPAKEFYETFRNGGLLCYYKHKINDNPYTRIGCQDITSHVDWTGLARYGKEAGLDVTGFTTQFYFLMALGILEEFKTIEDLSIKGAPQLEWNQKLKELLMPGGMGSTFKVLIQHKGIETPNLTGFSYRNFKDNLL
ncbi:MAG: SAM-dependent methyltransferase [Deltaproteobacteria bacterium]|nr:SAM-dependent methyltransferase [Deltaproteobacteria bacterium]